jgi:hypothetical protein
MHCDSKFNNVHMRAEIIVASGKVIDYCIILKSAWSYARSRLWYPQGSVCLGIVKEKLTLVFNRFFDRYYHI